MKANQADNRVATMLPGAGGLEQRLLRVARLMRAHGLRGVSRRKWTRTTLRDGDETRVPDPMERDFTASRPNALWVADATYIPT